MSLSPLEINSTKISFTNTAEHVGVCRSVEGNLPNLLNRILVSYAIRNHLVQLCPQDYQRPQDPIL